MGFSRYETRDSVISAELVVRGMWDGNATTLSTFYTSSAQVASSGSAYFTNVYSDITTSSLQFGIQYGHISGSGSILVNPSIPNNSVSRTVYGQYRNLLYGTQNTAILDSGLTGNPITDIFVVNVARSKYRESIKPGSLTLTLSGSSGVLQLTDDSNTTATTNYIDSNVYYNLRSGSLGVVNASTTTYGYVFPALGIILINPTAIVGYVTVPNRATPTTTDPQNATLLYNSIKLGGSFSLQSQETISSRFFFTRIYNNENNYTTNPSVIDANGNLLYATLINNPQTYITTIGLYNENHDLLAVAKLSKPLIKDFTKEVLLRVKLDY